MEDIKAVILGIPEAASSSGEPEGLARRLDEHLTELRGTVYDAVGLNAMSAPDATKEMCYRFVDAAFNKWDESGAQPSSEVSRAAITRDINNLADRVRDFLYRKWDLANAMPAPPEVVDLRAPAADPPGVASAITMKRPPEDPVDKTSPVTVEEYNRITSFPIESQKEIIASISNFRVTDPGMGRSGNTGIVLKSSRDGMFFIGHQDKHPVVLPLFRIKSEQISSLAGIYDASASGEVLRQNRVMVTAIVRAALCERYGETDWRVTGKGVLTLGSIERSETDSHPATAPDRMPPPVPAQREIHPEIVRHPPSGTISTSQDLVEHYNLLLKRADDEFDRWTKQHRYRRLSVSWQQLKERSLTDRHIPVELRFSDEGVLFLAELEGGTLVVPAIITRKSERKRVAACFEVTGERSVVDGRNPWRVTLLTKPATVQLFGEYWRLLSPGALVVRSAQ